MYLIDTSIWIGYLREYDNKAIQNFKHILDKKLFFGITTLIYQEILQGAASLQDFNKLSSYFSTQHFFYPLNDILTSQAAAKIYFDCKRKGITIRSTGDCLIAQIAIEQDLTLVHNDNDFIQLNKAIPKLKLLA